MEETELVLEDGQHTSWMTEVYTAIAVGEDTFIPIHIEMETLIKNRYVDCNMT